MIKFILFDFYNVLYFPKTKEFNTELFEFMADHNREMGFGILSAVNADLGEWLQKHDYKKYFQFIKTSAELGLPKTDPGVYQMVVSALELKPQQVLMVDDLSSNLIAATQAGLATLRYVRSKNFSDQLSMLKTS